MEKNMETTILGLGFRVSCFRLFGDSILKLNTRNKGALIIMGILGTFYGHRTSPNQANLNAVCFGDIFILV